MRILSFLLAAMSAACVAGAVWLGLRTYDYFSGPDYAPYSAFKPGYTAGHVEADGSGIFAPAILLFFIGVFLGRFAANLWREEVRRPRRRPGKRR